MKKKLLSLAISTVFLLNIAAPAFADSTPTTTETVPVTATATTSGDTATTTTTGDTTAVNGTTTTTSDVSAEAGILPDSPFYFLDKLFEQIVIIFNFSPEKKAKVLLVDANERLAEANTMADEGKQDLATNTAQAYVDTVEKAQVQISIAINEGQLSGTVDQTVYGTVYGNKKGSSVVAVVYGLDLSQKHAAEVLIRVLAKAPEQARKGLLNALKNVTKHQLDQNAQITVYINGTKLEAPVKGKPEDHKDSQKDKQEVKDKQEDQNKQDQDKQGKDKQEDTNKGNMHANGRGAKAQNTIKSNYGKGHEQNGRGSEHENEDNDN